MIIENQKGEYLELKFGEEMQGTCELTINAKSSFMTISHNTYALVDTLKKLCFVTEMCNNKKKGSFSVDTFSYANDFSVDIRYDESGDVIVMADVKSNDDIGNACSICFITTPEFIQKGLCEFKEELKF